jgi:hypothetical protein
VAHDRAVFDHPPLDNRLHDTTLRDATFHDTALDNAILVIVLDHRVASTTGQIVLVLLDHPALYARAVEVVVAINKGVAAPDLSLSRRGGHEGRPAEHQGREAGKCQGLEGKVLHPSLLNQHGERTSLTALGSYVGMDQGAC